MKQALILAGGKGTRLKERLGDLPKPLVDLCGIPLLERQVLLLKRYGFGKVIILVNHRAEAIEQFCEMNKNWGLNIACIDDGEPRGTAGAVLNVFDRLDEEFLVMYGDTMLEVDLNRFHDFHKSAMNASATLFLHPNDHPHDSDLVETDDNGDIVGFYPYPHAENEYYPNLVNAALYWIRKESLKEWAFCQGIQDFGKDLFPKMIQKGMRLRGYNSPEYIKDCGTPSRIDHVCEDFLSGRINRASLSTQQSAIFVDRDGTLNQVVDHLKDATHLKILPNVPQAVRRLNRAEYRVCVVTNQPVIARGDCTKQDLKQIHNKLETLLGREGAFVDRIYYCPHHPDRGYEGEVEELKIECSCRKPNIGLLDQAKNELNISYNSSWMIGDATSDILAAKKAGVRSILVETGYAGMDNKYWVTPDYVVPSFSEAVDFLLDIHPALQKIASSMLPMVHSKKVIFVGGQSRSGKSTFASVLKEVIQATGKRCHLIATDRWLLSQANRREGLFGRHDMLRFEAFLACIINAQNQTLNLPGYNKLKREQVDSVETLEIQSEDIFIVEGVVALSLPQINDYPRIYIDLDEEARRKRVVKEYQLRGYEKKKAEIVYQSRMVDEFRNIESSKADSIIINLTSVYDGVRV